MDARKVGVGLIVMNYLLLGGQYASCFVSKEG